MIVNGNVGLFNWLNKPRIGTKLNLQHPLTRGLVGFWPFNEGNGLPVELISNKQAASNSLSWTSLVSGRNLVLTGNGSSYFTMSVPDNSPLNVTGNAITYGGWLWSNSTSTYQTIIAKQDLVTQESRQYGIFTVAGVQNQIYVQINGASGLGPHGLGNNRAITVTTPWVLSQWNLILVTYDGINVGVYVNGKLGATLSAVGSVANISGTPIEVGYDLAFSGSGGNALIGSVDNLMVWNRTLSAKEIYNLWISPNSIWQIFEPQIDNSVLYRYLISKGTSPSIARVLLSSNNRLASLGLPLMRQ